MIYYCAIVKKYMSILPRIVIYKLSFFKTDPNLTVDLYKSKMPLFYIAVVPFKIKAFRHILLML